MHSLRVLSLSLCLLLPGIAAGQEAEAPFSTIDSLFLPWNRTDAPGCALNIIQQGKSVYRKGYGMASIEHLLPHTPASIFYVGSISKQFTAASIALLALDGKLQLDDDIRTYLPEFPDYGTPIRIRHLLHHTSGIRDYLTLMMLADIPLENVFTDRDILCLLGRQQALNFSPGSAYSYSNSNYFLLRLIVERVSGQSIETFARTRIFEPLHMQHTQYLSNRDRLIPLRATGYTYEGDTLRIDNQLPYVIGGGGVMTSVEDLYYWDQNFYHNQLGYDSLWIRLMHTRGVLTSGDTLPYALGLVLTSYRGLPVVEHGGAFAGFRAHYMRFPEEQTSIILLCNGAFFRPGTLARRIADHVLASRFPEPPPPEPSRRPSPSPTQPPPTELLQSLVGKYFSDELNVTYRLEASPRGLHLYTPHTLNAYLLPDSSAHTWKASEGNLVLHVLYEGDTVTGFRLDAGRARGILFRRVSAPPCPDYP